MKKIKSKYNFRKSCSVLKGQTQERFKVQISLHSSFCSFMTPLHVAAERAHNDVLEVLHKHGAKVRNLKICNGLD